MEIIFLPKSKEHLDFFKKVNNPIILKKIRQLLEIIPETPYSGIGKPEPLKHHLSGLWSRRINQEHRLVYEVIQADNVILIHSLKGHY
ncbi:Txe/YoeB family addiction module toxin [Flavobacterium franklandianum]|uniref:Putative mRNA interferase YoeB n=1 Tax=Flavobacterium franklandianum TaxID=2594430 RepID=A0A553CRE5_9FLAO|nr:Txe/YoeB family addiction module toxin [Flavobacterium franklandianum]TRX23057.1 Txe/YoeB family addiction module toxin [Flavobacterium franklandianum]TRX27623.1 Txe/YoeB family addiction module toxin [Flavobacterium franklandianum]